MGWKQDQKPGSMEAGGKPDVVEQHSSQSSIWAEQDFTLIMQRNYESKRHSYTKARLEGYQEHTWYAELAYN